VVCSTFTSERRIFAARGDLLAGVGQHVHVVAEDLDRHVAAHAGDQLVETQLDRLKNS
jgi:hypothetical protein